MVVNGKVIETVIRLPKARGRGDPCQKGGLPALEALILTPPATRCCFTSSGYPVIAREGERRGAPKSLGHHGLLPAHAHIPRLSDTSTHTEKMIYKQPVVFQRQQTAAPCGIPYPLYSLLTYFLLVCLLNRAAPQSAWAFICCVRGCSNLVACSSLESSVSIPQATSA